MIDIAIGMVDHAWELIGAGLVLAGGWLYGRSQRRRNRRKRK